jgi:hypothetical protein
VQEHRLDELFRLLSRRFLDPSTILFALFFAGCLPFQLLRNLSVRAFISIGRLHKVCVMLKGFDNQRKLLVRYVHACSLHDSSLPLGPPYQLSPRLHELLNEWCPWGLIAVQSAHGKTRVIKPHQLTGRHAGEPLS